jgi:hypothetical protein
MGFQWFGNVIGRCGSTCRDGRVQPHEIVISNADLTTPGPMVAGDEIDGNHLF